MLADGSRSADAPLGDDRAQCPVRLVELARRSLVDEDGDGGGTRFVWTTDVLPDDSAPTIEAMMAQGAAAIARTIRR